ncbi:hypothetical protein CS022_03655 [Veronia nyctiphanis]|uniref:Uncharacterized protein n=1 Tax=Veronia nyctiphanis TaxID=1278244 RepID=A0A4Q0YSJ7_9GAMM|nr:hypothetical protein [Veronia nyctiphanis]RXJ74182.1 hypothetical protein CS022_03655 [Veronia nyctiphanis]
MTSLLSKVNLIFTLIFFLISFPAISHNGPAPFPASYGPVVHPAVVKTTELDFGCDTFVFSIPCQRSEKVEFSLEKEFWAYVQNRDAEKMKTLINRMKGYAFSSRSEYAPRLYRLIGFGYMVRAQQSASITLSSAPNILMARIYAQKSDTSQPNNSHSVALRSFIDTVFPYVIGWGGLGDKIVNRMIAMPDQFGLPGYEGTISGAMSLAYTRDPERIRRGLEIMNNCQDSYVKGHPRWARLKKLGSCGQRQKHILH